MSSGKWVHRALPVRITEEERQWMQESELVRGALAEYERIAQQFHKSVEQGEITPRTHLLGRDKPGGMLERSMLTGGYGQLLVMVVECLSSHYHQVQPYEIEEKAMVITQEMTKGLRRGLAGAEKTARQNLRGGSKEK